MIQAAEIPVREVVLYKNGVGYFIRGGEIARGQAARLDFRADEMNDVLKSLTVQDASGNSVAGVRYDSADPLEKKLRDLPFQVAPGAPLSALLDQLRGARVEWNNSAGTIVGGRVVRNEKGEERETVTVLSGDGVLRTADLAGITTLKFSDAALQQQFRDYLAAIAASRSKDKKSVYIDAKSDLARQLQVSYLTPVPVWKSAYRLIFGEAAEATLEGWAIVDNTTGEDWTNVRMALVSGRPVSFQSQLYAPRYAPRPFADVAAGLDEPVIYSGGITPLPGDSGAGVPGQAGGVAGGVIGGFPGAVAGSVPRDKRVPPAAPMASVEAMFERVSPSSIGSAAAREVGELFEYRFGQPVTVRKNESAVLPFLQQKLTVLKLLIWTSGLHPRNAAEIVNATGKTLDGGPVTVFDGGAYAGEALVETVKTGDKRLISYAVDQGVRVTTNLESGTETIREAKLTRGILTTRTARQMTTTYTIRNTSAKAKTLIIEHPLHSESKIIGAQPVETTEAKRRFEAALKPASTETLKVVEETLDSATVAVSDLSPDKLLLYRQGQAVSAAARKALEEIAAKKKALAGVAGEIERARAQFAAIERDQQRLRENLRALGAVPGQQEQVQRYSQQLGVFETQLAALRDRQAALESQSATLDRELKDLLEKLSF